jgi:hypothetical protein
VRPALWTHVALVVVALTVLAGCSSDGGDATDLEREFDVRVSEAIEEATDAGASAQQLEILERAAAQGGVTFEDAKVAAQYTMDCMSARGVSSTYEETALSNGLTIPGYTVQAEKADGSSAFEDLEQCENSESLWVNMLYQMQPSSIEANLAFIEEQAPVVRKCLEDAGYDTDPDATGMELVIHSSDVARQTGGTVDCAFEAGIMGY